MFWGKRIVLGAFGTAAILLYGISFSTAAESSVVLVIHEVADTLTEPAMTAAEVPPPPSVPIKIASNEESRLPVPEMKDPAASMAIAPSPLPPTAVSHDSRPIAQRSPAAPALDSIVGGTDSEAEAVTDRYPNGAVHTEREVALDADKNYVNHGSYVTYDQNGVVTLRGHYRMGKMDGAWSRQFPPSAEKGFVSGLPGSVKGLLVAEATFENGMLHGAWVVKTQDQKKLAEWQFDHGMRHGTSTWWYLNGQKQAELTYSNGQPVGELAEWDENGKQTDSSKFVEGRLVTRVVKYYAPGQKEFEGYYLRQQDLGEPSPEWWTGAKIVSSKEPADGDIPKTRHGLWTSYYANGQKQTQGEFRNDMPVGKFVWWYENGQRQAQGEYADGARQGTWITWYASGQRESKTEYQRGDLVGQSMRWKADGTLADIQDFQSVPQNAEKAPDKSPLPKKSARVTSIPTY